MKQRGMSLIELLVSLGLGAFLILGVVNVFIANKESTQVEQSLSRLQENGRIALDLIADDLRQAYYIGCNSEQGTLTVMADGSSFDGMLGFERTTVGWSPALPAKLAAITGEGRPGSDVINVMHGRDLEASITAAVTTSSTSISVDGNPDCVGSNERVIIGSCSTAHLFQVTNLPDCGAGATSFEFASAANTPSSMIPGYSTDDRLMRYIDTTWYVADTGRDRTAGSIPVFALYRVAAGNAAEEMVEGVEYMEIQYGQRLSTGNIRYTPADDANLDMDDVVSIRLALLIQSFEPVLDAPDTKAYQLLDQSIDSTGTAFTHNGDTALRRVFQTTVLLRNLQNRT